jgi:predicted transcriptional regulator
MGKAPQLSELQLDVMRVLWRHGEATVAAVQADLEPVRQLALATVATLLRRLERRGVVAYRTEGRQFVYRAEVTEEEVTDSMVDGLAQTLFSGDVASLVCHFLNQQDMSTEDWQRVRELIDSKATHPESED